LGSRRTLDPDAGIDVVEVFVGMDVVRAEHGIGKPSLRAQRPGPRPIAVRRHGRQHDDPQAEGDMNAVQETSSHEMQGLRTGMLALPYGVSL
jgi:hypothetical protein